MAARFANWEGDIGSAGAALALRLASGLHALVLKGIDPHLEAAYPPNNVANPVFINAVIGAMTRHDEFLCHWIESASQTNEVGRSGVIIAAAHWLHTNFGLPLKLSELGASAGLNLLFDKYTLQIGKRYWGSREATVRLTPGWQGNLPPLSQPHIVERRGVDLSPLRAGHPEDELRLISYIWADQTNRIKRARAALAFSPPQVDKADAIEWLPNRLAVPWFGSMHLI